MRRLKAICLILCVALTCSALDIGAQSPQRSDTLVDVLGLRRWTRQQLEATLQRYEPGISLASGACAVILRDSVGFDAASVMTYPAWQDHPAWVIVTVVEPGQGKPVPPPATGTRGSETLPARWQAMDSTLNYSWPVVSALQDPSFLLTDTSYAFGRPVGAGALAFRTKLRALATKEDLRVALSVIQQADWKRRALAAAVLSNFPEDKDVWAALLRADVGWNDSGSSMADMVMLGLAKSGRFTVDWSGSEGVLESAFSGWNPFALPTLMTALVQTKANRAEVIAALRREPNLVLDYLSAKNPYTPGMVRPFLIYLAGKDLGADASAWQSWLSKPNASPSAKQWMGHFG